MKKLKFIQRGDTPHWVGDGFPVRSIFTYRDIASEISPFLFLDYGGPTEFPPHRGSIRRGVGSHPHRGFETVTIVYEGQVEHRDSAGGGGVIHRDDVQWMTAGSGLVHEERHGREYSRTGGPFEMVQLWVNLPRKDKMTKPRYQGIKSAQIPQIILPGLSEQKPAGLLRVIAGQYEGQLGPAKTFSPINLWDLQLTTAGEVSLEVPVGHTATVFVLKGQLKTLSGELVNSAELAVFESTGSLLQFTAPAGARMLFLGGEPLNEPIVGHGPFVMNTPAEILQAMRDFEDGKMGVLESLDGSES